MTASGGEPLSQAEALEALFSSCRNEGISTAIETSGFAPHAVLERIAPLTKLFLYDLKHMDDGIHKSLRASATDRFLKTWPGFSITSTPSVCACLSSMAVTLMTPKSRPASVFSCHGRVLSVSGGWISCPITRWASKSTNSSTCPTASTTGLRLARKLWNVYGNSLTKPAFPSPSSAINGVFSNTGKNEHNDILGLSSDRYPL